MFTSTSGKKKLLVVVAILCMTIVVANSFPQQKQEHEEPAPKNLKVLPKTTTGEEVRQIMKTYSRSLGVRCNHCHAGKKQEGDPFMRMDFAADAKPEKEIARKMMVMVDSINTVFLSKMSGEDDFEKISCVTCHMGNLKPMVSVDSLPQK